MFYSGSVVPTTTATGGIPSSWRPPFWEADATAVDGKLYKELDLSADISPLEAASIRFDPDRQIDIGDFSKGHVSDANRDLLALARSIRINDARLLPSSPVIVSGNSPENHQHSSDQDIALDLDGVILPALSASQHRQTTADNRIKPEIGDGNPHLDTTSDESKGIEVLRAELERLQRVGTVWCCFPRFEDDAMEEAFVQERMALLPHAASRMWFAYALFVFGILILLLVDLSEPTGVIAVIMLTVAIGLALVIGAVPRTLSRERMQRWFFAWSMTAVVLPLIVVYGTAVARPNLHEMMPSLTAVSIHSDRGLQDAASPGDPPPRALHRFV